jgi:NADH-quinone oxidoreductase subunit C
MTRKTEIRKILRIKADDITIKEKDRFKIAVTKENLKSVIRRLTNFENYSHISSIIGIDKEFDIELIYHIICKDALFSISVKILKDKPFLPTITDIIPGVALYEREIHDFFGVVFEGNTDMSSLFLPDNWSDSVYPLRKWWTVERINSKVDRVK